MESHKKWQGRSTYRLRLLSVLLLLIGLGFAAFALRPTPSGGALAGVALRGSGPSGAGTSSSAAVAEARTEQLPNGGVVGYSVYHDTSQALRDMAQIPPTVLGRAENEKLWRLPHPQSDAKHTVVQSLLGPRAMPAPIMTFEGIPQVNSSCRCLPPDPNGDVGPNHYVQTVNTAYHI